MDHLTNIELFEIFKESKKSRFDKEPNFDLVVSSVCLKLNVPSSDKLLSDIKSVFAEYKQQQQQNRSLANSDRNSDETISLLRKNYLKKTKRPLDEVGDRQQRRRLSDYVEATSNKAAEENTSPTKLYAYGLKHKYLKDKTVARLGKTVFENKESSSSSHVSLEIASAIYSTGKMTKRIYTEIRLLLKDAGKDVLPTYEKLDEFKRENRPTVKPLEEPWFQGVKYDYVECLKYTTSQLLKSIELPIFHQLNELHLKLHDGLDGSGGHSVFNQRGSTETNNIIMYMFRIENLKTSTGELVWQNPSHASSSSCRPVMLLMGKENKENLDIVTDVQKERKDCQFVVQHHSKPVNVKVDATMSMIDGKMHSLISGYGGAFCCLCTYSKEQCHDAVSITNGFKIDRSLEQALAICETGIHRLENRKAGDYEERQGITQDPITIEDINNLHPLHNLLRCFGWIFKICYHATAAHYSWSEAKMNVSNRIARALDFLKQAKEQIQAKVKEETSITMEKPDPTGHGGTSTTGNVASVILNTGNRRLLTEGIDNADLKAKIDRIILRMAVILTINSSDKNVRVAEFKEFCCETYLLVNEISWIQVSPSAHIVLAHSAELIEQNDSKGLLNFTECGIEANNKFLRQYRMNYARKTSQFDNLSDCINRLWDKSDPMVLKVCNRLQCAHCKGKGHTIRSCDELKEALHRCNSEYETLVAFLSY